ncbi:acyl carrier protein [Streptomyces yunnanensis]|uniref:Acyl carrier protein n=1 Tax=Streptomyces yunnanensis TaxID=156453 RepID=A0ABY8AJ81_9ACTN|nr:acyl carrier protein [Streptomyces yunnanensis]WEB45098.1 acyl carrier protein [Streptomyces yunnanensis]
MAELPEYASEPPRPGAGFDTYRLARGGLPDLLRPALKDALAAAGTPPAAVDTVLFATESLPGGEASQTAVAQLLGDLGMSHAYPLTLGLADCSTATAALTVAAALVGSGAAGTVAVVSGDLVRTVLPGGRVLLGGSAVASDGAAAAVVSARRHGWEILGGARQVSYDLFGPSPAAHRLGAQLAAYQGLFEDLWSATGLTPPEVAAVLPSNLAADTLRLFLGEAGFAPRQLYQDNVGRIAHCLGSDPLINLIDRTEAGTTRGAYPVVALLGSSAAHLAAVLLRAVED